MEREYMRGFWTGSSLTEAEGAAYVYKHLFPHIPNGPYKAGYEAGIHHVIAPKS